MFFWHFCLLISQVECGKGRGSRRKQKEEKIEKVKILASLPEDDKYLFSQNHVRPAINYALQTIKDEANFLSNFQFDVEYIDSGCNREAMLTTADSFYENKRNGTEVDLILGPVCSHAADGVNDFSKFWNKAMITSGAMAMAFTEVYQPTLTRITAPFTEIGEFFKSLFVQLDYWKHTIHLLYHSPEDLSKDCYFAMEAIQYTLQMNTGTRFRVVNTVVQYPMCCINYDEVLDQMKDPRVVITCGSENFVRNMMIAAKQRKMTEPEQNVWYTVDLFNASYFGHGAWKRNDERDEEAREAYKALQVVTLRTNVRNAKRTIKGDYEPSSAADSSMSPRQGQFEHFSQTMAEDYRKMGILEDNEEFRVNSFVEGFHDAMILYAMAIDASLGDDSDWRDGTQISAQMRARQMNGIASQVKIDEHGNRFGDYSLLAMDSRDTSANKYKFKTIYTFLRSKGIGTSETPVLPRIYVPELPVWDVPIDIGQEQLLASSSLDVLASREQSNRWLMYAGGLLLAAVVLSGVILVSVLLCRRMKPASKAIPPQLRHPTLQRTHAPLHKELSTYSTNSVGAVSYAAPMSAAGRSQGRRSSLSATGHMALERTVTQVTYCPDEFERRHSLHSRDNLEESQSHYQNA